jgi:5-dehydro-2-deoxygluconokinase
VRRNRLELLVELVPSKVAPVDGAGLARLIRRLCDLGIHPDWWTLEPATAPADWAAACAAIGARDPRVRGVPVLGLGLDEARLAQAFAAAARQPLAKGFAVGRTIRAGAGADWFAGRLDDAGAVERMAARFAARCALRDAAAGEART